MTLCHDIKTNVHRQSQCDCGFFLMYEFFKIHLLGALLLHSKMVLTSTLKWEIQDSLFVDLLL